MDLNIQNFQKVKIFVSNDCDLNCIYCTYKDNNINNEEQIGVSTISLDLLLQIIEKVSNNCKKNNSVLDPEVTFIGGEPLLFFEELIQPAINYGRELNPNYVFSIETNGLLLTEDILTYLKEKGIHLILKFNGSERASHLTQNEINFERDVWNIIDQKLNLILEFLPQTTIKLILTETTLPFLFESIQYLEEKDINKCEIFLNQFEDWNQITTKEILVQQFNNLFEYWKNVFDEEGIPLIPSNFNNSFIRVILNDYLKENNLFRSFSATKPENRFGQLLNQEIWIDFNGNYYTTHPYFFNKINHDFYDIEKFPEETEKLENMLDEDKSAFYHETFLKNNYNPFYIGNINFGINKKYLEDLHSYVSRDKSSSLHLTCEECPVYLICLGNSADLNFYTQEDFCKCPYIYCIWDQQVFLLCKKMLEYFEETKNDLFRQYLEHQMQGGLFVDGY